MKLLWALSFFLVFSAEIKVKASASKNSQILSCSNSWIKSDQLIEGCHWLRQSGKRQLTTVYGEIYSQGTDYTVNYIDNRIYVVNHLGDLQVKLRDGRVVQVPPGFEFWFSELGVDKHNLMGILRPVDMSEHIQLLARLWPSSSSELKKQISLYKNRWGNRNEIAAKFYQGLVERKIASAEAVKAQAYQKELNEKRRREANKKMLFERAFGR